MRGTTGVTVLAVFLEQEAAHVSVLRRLPHDGSHDRRTSPRDGRTAAPTRSCESPRGAACHLPCVFLAPASDPIRGEMTTNADLTVPHPCESRDMYEIDRDCADQLHPETPDGCRKSSTATPAPPVPPRRRASVAVSSTATLTSPGCRNARTRRVSIAVSPAWMADSRTRIR